NKPNSPLLPTPPLRTRFRQLSSAELTERREKGLCFNCDERFSRNHRCKARFLLLIAEEEEEVGIQETTEEEQDPIPDPLLAWFGQREEAQLSYHAMSGAKAAQTIRVLGRVEPHSVHVLVDGGSTLNFIQAQAARKLGLVHSQSPQLKVTVGNGEELLSNHVCKGVQIVLQGHKFEVDLYTLALSGPDVVLGTPWLRTLGPVMMDYGALTMKFVHENQQVELKGEQGPITSSISYHQLKKLVQQDPTAQVFSLSIVDSTTPSPNQITHSNPKIHHLLQRYTSLFDEPTHLPPPRFTDHGIPLLPSAPPVNVRPYRYPHAQKLEIESQVQKLLQNGWIQPSNSPFSSPVLLLKKKDGSWRMCVDYRALNAITIKDRFPLPTVDELLDELGSARVFSKLDLTSGFHQIRLKPEDSLKTAFRTHDGHYEYKVMPFGLCNAPATFQATMNDIFRPLLRKTVIVFFDDILVYSDTEEQHIQHLAHVFHLLCEHKLFLKAPKCSFGQTKIDYLGHVVTQGTVGPDPSKVQAILEWPTPKTLKALRGFLGLSGYYRKFIKGYASIALPLTSLLKKDAFHWNSEAQAALDRLKQAMVSAPVLALPDFSSHFVIQTDASGYAMGAVLLQKDHPIAFYSSVFCPRMSKASTYIRELHAITSAVKRWRQYLLGHFFIIQTDHKSLKEILTQVIQTPEQQHYLSKLLGYHYEIQYKSGVTNVVADALSRAPESTSSVIMQLTVPQFLFLEELKQELLADPVFIDLRDRCLADPLSLPDFHVVDGLLLRRGRIWVSPASRFKQLLLREFHETLVGGHAGLSRTMKRLAENFYWDNMKKEAQLFIRQCVVCQKTKYLTGKPNGLLQPLPLPNNVWEDISMDFVTGLPNSKGYTVIMVVVDRFSKGIHLGVLPTSFTAYKVAELFVSMVCKLHGLPKSIVSDRDPIFISRFWADLFKFSGTLLRMSSSYHPQTDGQTEVMNRTIEQYLRAFVHEKPSQWASLLPWAEYHYNTSVHTASGLSPFQVMFGKPPPSIPAYITGTSSIDACDAVLASREEILTLLRKKLAKAQLQMKASADKRRRDVDFPVGGWVYLKLQPYRQISVSGMKYHKLAKRFYGPYLILAKIGAVAYKLALPPQSKIHNVFHCSCLKLHEGPPPTTFDQLPPDSVENHPLVVPLAILDFQSHLMDGQLVRFALVQWHGLLPDDTSWERWDELCKVYNLEDKVGFVGGDIDMMQPKNTGPTDSNIIDPASEVPKAKKRISKAPKKWEDYVSYLERVDSLERASPEVQQQPEPEVHSEQSTPTPPPHKTPNLKLDVPRFQGTDPHGWIFKISQFFAYHQT
ncbi:Ty3/gypsy retrotransposon protein, partial [Trifolium medium]|nr:Ty3/gypsy retrotransposon protein [Trifolium medium]